MSATVSAAAAVYSSFLSNSLSSSLCSSPLFPFGEQKQSPQHSQQQVNQQKSVWDVVLMVLRVFSKLLKETTIYTRI